ncbi:MAG TPA: proton-conducting transporter membrane subunit [Candidatus Binatia bacterium]|nr:proton-conducting transporter membrane subunit [Candidatus Binatia bacterium]
MIASQLPALLVVVPLLAALGVPLLAWPWPRAAWPVAVLATAATALLAVAGMLRALAGETMRYAAGGWAAPWGIELVLDPLSAFVALVVAGVAAWSVLYGAGVDDPRTRDRQGVVAALVLLVLAALLGIVVAGDLFNLFVFLEVGAIATYALVGVGGGRALVASFRYVILGSLGASLYLLGVGHLYLATGTLNMADMAARLPGTEPSRLVPLAVGLVVVGLGIKMGLFPLHGWLPDAYTHAPPAVTALIAPVATKVAAYALVRFLFTVLGPAYLLEHTLLGSALTWLGALSILAGGILAIRQTDFRKVLAYSSVSQMGYIALGIGLANPSGVLGAYLHILNHALMKGCLFFVAGIATLRLGGSALSDLRHMHRRMPVVTLCLVVAALSMVGVPPTGGFFSKWYVLLGAVEAGRFGLAGIVLAGSLLAVAYMFRIVESACLEPRGEDGHGHDRDGHAGPRRREPAAALLASVLALAAAVVAAGVWNAPIVDALRRAPMAGP